MIEIAVDIGVVEFNAGQNHMLGPVVEKFRPFVEKGGVVLVAFDDHVVAARRLSNRCRN